MSSSNRSFAINPETFQQSDLDLYQKLLLEFKVTYKHTANSCVSFHQGEQPPRDNKFAEFRYTCNNNVESWFLPWNPLNEKDRNKLRWDYNPECAPEAFKKISDSMFKKLRNSLPDSIDYTTHSFQPEYQIYYDAFPCYENDCEFCGLESCKCKSQGEYKQVEDYDPFAN